MARATWTQCSWPIPNLPASSLRLRNQYMCLFESQCSRRIWLLRETSSRRCFNPLRSRRVCERRKLSIQSRKLRCRNYGRRMHGSRRTKKKWRKVMNERFQDWKDRSGSERGNIRLGDRSTTNTHLNQRSQPATLTTTPPRPRVKLSPKQEAETSTRRNTVMIIDRALKLYWRTRLANHSINNSPSSMRPPQNNSSALPHTNPLRVLLGAERDDTQSTRGMASLIS